MYRMFFRSLAHEMPANNHSFTARSIERDAETDHRRVASVMGALEVAIREAKDEQSGLKHRVDDALARAAVTLGNGSDEYLEREPLDNRHQSLFSSQISNGERRLSELNGIISHLQFLKTDVQNRFPQFVS